MVEQAERVLRELLPETAGLVVAIGLPRLYQRALFNSLSAVLAMLLINCYEIYWDLRCVSITTSSSQRAYILAEEHGK